MSAHSFTRLWATRIVKTILLVIIVNFIEIEYKIFPSFNQLLICSFNSGLQAEIVSANKEGEGIRQKLRRQEGEMELLRMKITETEDYASQQYGDYSVLF